MRWPWQMPKAGWLTASPYALVTLLWAGAFLLWVKVYRLFIQDPETFQHDGCCAVAPSFPCR